jgi:hypothetical protein
MPMETSRSLFEKASLALVALALVGCGLPDEADHPSTEQVTSSLVIPTLMDFSKNTPSVQRPGGSAITEKALTQRVGYGSRADEIMSLTGNRLDTVNLAPSSARKAQSRPISSWLGTTDFFSSIYLPMTTVDRFQDVAAPPGPSVFPSLTTCPGGATPCMLGSASTSFLAADGFADAGAFAVGLDNSNPDPNKHFYRLRQAQRPFGVWQDSSLPFLIGGTEYFPTSTPIVVTRATGGPIPGCAGATPSDSVWFACTPASQPQLCEVRLTPSGNQFYKATIGNTTSVFAANTRPTAVANTVSGVRSDRWIFAVTSETSSGTIVVRAKRETSCPDSTTPTWAFDDTVLTSGPGSNTYSTPMPYVRRDGKTAITFFRYVPSSSTEVWEATYSAASGWVATRIHIIGRVIPPGNEPTGTDVTNSFDVPSGQDSQSSIYFRLPHPTLAGVRDTIRLIQEPAGKYAAMMVKPAIDESKLFVVQDSTDKLYQIDMTTGARSQLGAASWTGTTAFATDGVGLGYAVVNGTLWEVNLNSGDGQRRQIGGTNAFAGTTHLVYGFDGAVETVPRLWAFRSNNHYMVQLSDGTQTRLPGQPLGWWHSVKAVTTATDPTQVGQHATRMFAVKDTTLFEVDILSGTVNPLSNAGDWPTVTAMTANPALQRLFIADGTNTSNMRVYRVTYSGEWNHGHSGLFSNAQFMTTRNGDSYIMKARKLHRIISTQDSDGQTITLSGLGSQIWDYTEKGMAATSW